MNNIIEVEFCKVMQVIEHVRNPIHKPKYTFVLGLLFDEPKVCLNTILKDMETKNTFRVTDKNDSLYTCTMIRSKRYKRLRKPKRLEILYVPVSDNLSKKEVCAITAFDMDSLDKQINGQSDMLCMLYDDSNKMYCDLLKSNVSENYDIRIVVKKK